MNRAISGMTHAGQELQDTAFLLAQGKKCGQDTLNKQATLFTLRVKRVITPKEPGRKGAL